ncbi:MAG: DnaJ domain-containing protein [Acidobacteria bacterium]|nr:DnaJ domain-containing protein [Acidobacteriota bacterium]
MTYYEELGVPTTASQEEIREAYKQLARLLHPDKLQDPQQRKVAECQMRRLNAVYETLSHLEQRRTYDLTLQPAAQVEPIDEGEEPTGWRWVLRKLRGPDGAWIGAGVIVASLMIYAVIDTSGHGILPATPTPVLAQNTKPKPQVKNEPERRKPDTPDPLLAQLRHRVEELTTERDAALQRNAQLEGRIRDLSRKPEPAVSALLPAGRPPPAPDPASGHTLPNPPQESPGITGTWYFAKTRSNSASDLYPPEFIETIIHEENGAITGRYRARYLVSDRAISPEVSFQFRGKPGAPPTRIPWTGAGGAKGEVNLRLLTSNSLEVAWVAHDLGNALGLAYGTAVLIRASEPR